MKRFILPLLFIVPAAAAPLEIATIAREEPVDFAREIYPLLKRSCLACHNTTRAKAGLNLESPQFMRKGGDSGPALADGNALDTLLLKSAAHLEDDLVMPPPDNKVNAPALTPAELGLLRLWIEQGAQGDAVPGETIAPDWRAFSSAAIHAVAFSPDGRTLAAGAGNRLLVAEVATGRVVAAPGDPRLAELDAWKGRSVADRDAVMSVAFGDDVIATGGFREVRVWRRGSRAVVRELGRLPGKVTALAGSPGGHHVAAGDANGVVWLWDLRAEKPEPAQLKEHAAPVSALAFSPDGGVLISGAEDRGVRLWSPARKRAFLRLTVPAVPRAFAAADAPRMIAGAFADGTLRGWTWPSPDAPMQPAWEIKVQEQPVEALAAMKQELAWAGADGWLHILGAADRKERAVLAPEHPAAAEAADREREMQVSRARAEHFKAAAGTAAAAVKKRDEETKKAADTLVKARMELHERTVAARVAREAAAADAANKGLQDEARKAADGLVRAETSFRGARANVELSARLAAETAAAHAAAAATLVAAEADAAYFQAALDAARKRAGEQQAPPRHLSASPDGALLLACGADGVSRRIATEGGALASAPEKTGQSILLPAGDLLCAGADGVLRVLSAERQWSLERVIGSVDDAAIFPDRVTALALSPDGRLLAAGSGVPSRSGVLSTWRIADGARLVHLPGAHADTINGVCFSPDGNQIATAGSDRFARVWNAVDGTRLANLEGHSGHVLSVAWRGDGLALATAAADGSQRTWDTATWRQVKKTDNFGAEVTAVAFAGQGAILTASAGQIRLGDAALPSAAGVQFCAASDAGGRFLAAGGEDGVLRVWTAADRKLWRSIGAAP